MLSVIVPVYNVEKYVKQCIDSLVSQTYQDIEIIVIDDGSTDDSGEICDSYKNTIYSDKIKVIHKKNGGLVSSRKEGIKFAQGEYVTFVDSDDYVLADTFEKAMKVLSNADILCYGFTSVYDNGLTQEVANAIQSGIYEGETLIELKKSALFTGDFYQPGILASLCCKIFRREHVIKDLLNVDEIIRMGEDACCTYPAIVSSAKIVVDNNNVGYQYRRQNGTMSTSYDPIYFNRIESLFNILKSSFEKENAEYMLYQLKYYLIFLSEIGFYQEVYTKKFREIRKKIGKIDSYKKFNWVEYAYSDIELELINPATRYINEIIHCKKTSLQFLLKVYYQLIKQKIVR